MADRVLFITWGDVTSGREEHALEVFGEGLGLYGRMQQDGRIESFDVALMDPNGGVAGYIALKGSARQMAAVRDDIEFRRAMADASMVVRDLCIADGRTDDGVADEIGLFAEAAGKVRQLA